MIYRIRLYYHNTLKRTGYRPFQGGSTVSFVCASVVSYVLFVLSLFVSHLSFFWCLERAVLRDCRTSCPVSILYKSIAGRYRLVRVADGPITARYRFIKNASCVDTFTYISGYSSSFVHIGN